MEITTVPNLKAEKVRIKIGDGGVGTFFLDLVVVNLQNGSYMIAEESSDMEYQRVNVYNLEKEEIKTELRDYLLCSNLEQGDMTLEQLDKIAEAISKLNL